MASLQAHSSLLPGYRGTEWFVIYWCGFVACMQAVQKGLADLAGPGGAEAAADSLRMVDTYIKVCAVHLPTDSSHGE